MRRLPRASRRQPAFASGAVALSHSVRDLALFRASDGLSNQVTNRPWGNLAEVSGSVAISRDGSIRGQPYYAPRKLSGGYLEVTSTPYGTAPGTPTNYSAVDPFTLFVLARCAIPASATANNHVAGGDTSYLAWATSGVNAVIVSATTATITNPGGTGAGNWHLYEIYIHNNKSAVSVDGGAFTAAAALAAGVLSSRILVGATHGGAARSDSDVAYMRIIEGPSTSSIRAAVYSEIAAQFGLSYGPGPSDWSAYSSASGWPSVPFYVIPCLGQSNNSTNATNPGTGAWDPAAYLLTNATGCIQASTYPQGTNGTRYDYPTGQTDRASADSTGILDYGNAVALANRVIALTGKPCVIIPCALGGSALVDGCQPGSLPSYIWRLDWPFGNLLRNSLAGSAIGRIQDALSHGGTVPFLWYYQGEQEAIQTNAALAEQWSTDVGTVLSGIAAAAGITDRAIYAQIAATIPTSAPVGNQWTHFREDVQPLAQTAAHLMYSVPDGPFEAGSNDIHLGASACDVVGTGVADLAFAQGWLA